MYGGVVRKYLSNIHLPTKTTSDQELVSDLIKSHKEKENQSQEKKRELREQRSENYEKLKIFEKEIQNAEDKLKEGKKKLEDEFKLLKSQIEVWSPHFCLAYFIFWFFTNCRDYVR